MSKNNQDIMNLKNIIANVATSQQHLATDSLTKQSSPSTKQTSKKTSSTRKTNIVSVEDIDSKGSSPTTDSNYTAKGINPSLTDTEIEIQEEEGRSIEETVVNKLEEIEPDTSRKVTNKRKVQKTDSKKVTDDLSPSEKQLGNKVSPIDKTTKGQPRGSKKKKASNDFSIFICLTDYEEVPSPEKDFTSTRIMSRKSEALKILYPGLSKVAIYDKLATEHLQQKEKEFEEALKNKYKAYKNYW